MRMIRVLHVYPRLICGGVEKVIENIIRFSDRHRYAFEILTQDEGDNEDVFSDLGVKIIRIPYRDDETSYRRQLKELFSTGDYSAIHCHSHREMSIINMEAEKAGIPVRIAHSHNAHQDISGLRKWLRGIKFRRHKRGATDLIGCSKDALDWMFPAPGQRGLIITNGIDFKHFRFSLNLRNLIRSQFGIRESTTLLLNIGRASLQKNQNLILEIAHQSREADRVFAIMGDGPMLEDLKAKASEQELNNIIFLGERKDTEAWLSAADIFLFPSVFEGHPLAPMEAQAAGLPVIASKAIPDETRINGGRFIKVNDWNPQHWLDSIIEIEQGIDNSVAVRTITTPTDPEKEVETMANRFCRLYSPPPTVFCHAYTPKGITGGERYDAQFTKSLSRATGVETGNYIADNDSYGLTGATKFLRPISALNGIRRIIKRYRRIGKDYPAFLFNTSKCLYFLPALLMLKTYGIKTVGITHHPLYIQMRGWKRKIYELTELLFIRLLDFRIAPSVYTARLLHKRLPNKDFTIIRIPFGNTQDRTRQQTFSQKRTKKGPSLIGESKKTSNFASGEIDLISIGTIERRKGLGRLLRAMLILKSKGIRTRLKAVGSIMDEKYASDLRALAVENDLAVEWEGYVSETRKRELLENADLFVLPSEAEGFGIVLVEAMQAGTPVAAFRNTGVVDVIGENEERGFLATDGDPEALAETIHRIMRNPDLCRQKILAATEWISTLPSNEDFDREIETLCGNIL